MNTAPDAARPVAGQVTAEAPLLVVEGLKVEFDTPRGIVRAVDGISYSVDRSEVLALVGESGCGKSVSALALIRLLPRPAGRIAGGRVFFEGVDLLQLSDEEVRSLVEDFLVPRLVQEPAAPIAGALLADVVADRTHHGLVDLALDELHSWLSANPGTYVAVLGERAPWWSPPWVDERVMDRPRIVLGGGSRNWKVLCAPRELRKIAGAEVVAGLAVPIEG